MRQIEQQAFRADAKKALTRMTQIMEHPAVSEHSWAKSDMDAVNAALDALRRMGEPRTMVGRLLSERSMDAIENGLYWTVAMLGRNGFQDAKGVAWQEADREFAEATLAEHSRLTQHQRN
jgi:hypothetical protein